MDGTFIFFLVYFLRSFDMHNICIRILKVYARKSLRMGINIVLKYIYKIKIIRIVSESDRIVLTLFEISVSVPNKVLQK